MKRSNSIRKGISGFTIIEMVIVMIIAGTVLTAATAAFFKLRASTNDSNLTRVATLLNKSTATFVTTGGIISAGDSPQDVLTQLQTPVDATSQKAGLGIFPIIDYHWRLSPVDASFSGLRLTYVYDASAGVPTWGTSKVGSGFTWSNLSSATEPAVADWTSRVNAAGMVMARTSTWVWDYQDLAPGGGGSTGGGTPPIYNPGNPGSLAISGPASIIAPGSYYWTGIASQPATLTISSDVTSKSVNNATRVQLPPRDFQPGDNISFTVSLSRGTGGSIAKTVSVCVPNSVSLQLTGPDTVTTLDPQVWTVSTTNGDKASTLAIQVDGGTAQSGSDLSTISTSNTVFTAGTNKTILVAGSAMTSTGFARATKNVVVNIPNSKQFCWTGSVTVSDGQTITAEVINIYKDGSATPTQVISSPAPGSTFNGTVTLEPGDYSIRGVVTIDGTDYVTNTLNLSVIP